MVPVLRNIKVNLIHALYCMKQIVNHLSALTILTFTNERKHFIFNNFKEMREKEQIDQKKKDRNNEQGEKN